MKARYILVAAFALAYCTPALAQSDESASLATPTLRPSASISADVVRIGDLVDNAGNAAQIAIYRAPDLGTTGTLRTQQLLDVLRANQVIGVDTKDIREVTVTRLSRAFSAKDIQDQIAKALEHRNGLGDAVNLSMTFDRDLRDVQLNASNAGDIVPSSVRYDSRTARFDVTLDIANDTTGVPAKLRFTGIVFETIDAAIPVRDIDRGEILKTSDITIERRPKIQVGTDAAPRDRVIGMETRRAVRAGQPLKATDISRADLVTRDQNVTLIYEAPGLYLTGRGKALEGGVEGDTVSVVNIQSKRTVQGVVTGPSQVTIAAISPRSPITQAASLQSATAAKTE